jgi:hypothetical protein
VREQFVRYKYQAPFCRFVIRLADDSRIHVNEPGRLGHFDDEKVQFTDARGPLEVDRLPRDCGRGV